MMTISIRLKVKKSYGQMDIDKYVFSNNAFHIQFYISLNMIIISTISKQGPQGPHWLSYLKSLKIRNPPPLLNIFTPATIRNGFLIKIRDGNTVENVQIDQQTTE